MSAPSDHNSPMSSSETISGSASPFAPRQIVPRKQRSSSVNSVGSNVSNQRSMSIVSLELPRNSIVSVEDILLRRVCNSSTTSLTSLAPVTSPTDPKEHYTISNRMHKPRAKTSSAVFSDEDSESEMSISRFRWRRRSSEKSLTNFLPNLKRDFKFRYGGAFGLPKTSASKPADDVVPSPLSFSGDLHLHNTHHAPLLPNPIHSSPPPMDCHLASPHLHHLPNLHSTTNSVPPHPLNSSINSIPAKADPEVARPSVSGKKVRTSSITQSMILKRRLLLSKDIQHELVSSHGSPLVTPTSLINSESRFPSISTPSSVSRPLHTLTRSDSSSTVILPALPNPADHAKHITLGRPPLDMLQIPVDSGSVKTQNKLIYELNRKWNKTFFDAKSPEERDQAGDTQKSSRKRNRSALISSMESSRLM